MSEMRILDVSGDTKMIWTAENAVEVDAARRTFNDLTGKGYVAYSVKKNGKKGEIIRKFDSNAERIILAPAIVGG